MKLTDLFIKRPVLAIVVNLVILIAGIQFRALDLPVSDPTIKGCSQERERPLPHPFVLASNSAWLDVRHSIQPGFVL